MANAEVVLLETLQERKQIIIDDVAALGYPYTEYDQGRKVGGYAAMAQFALGNINTGQEYVNIHLNRNQDMFWGMNVMEAYMKYKQYYTTEMQAKVKSKMLSFNILNADGTGLLGTTENHRLMYAAIGVIGAQEWSDYPANYAAIARSYLLSELPKIVTQGYWEYDSPTYFVHHTGPLLLVTEYCTDTTLREMVRLTLEWYFASIVGEWLHGYWVTSQGRTYNAQQEPAITLDESAVQLWMLFGDSRKPMYLGNETNLKFTSIPFALSEYELPSIFTRIATDRSTTYTHKERMARNSNNPYKTCYITPDYAVFGQKDNRQAQNQLHRWGLKWVGDSYDDEPNTFFMKQHYSETINLDPSASEYWIGGTNMEEVLQNDGTMLAVYNMIGSNTWIDGPVSYNGIKATIEQNAVERNGWIFFHAGKVMLAVRTAKPYNWTCGTESWRYGGLERALRSDGAKNGVIVETAPVAGYAGGTALSELERFIEAVLSNTVVDFSGIDGANPRIYYKSLTGAEMEIVYGTSRKINGKAVSYTNWPLLDNPWMHQDYNSSKLVLKHGLETRTYDFLNWTVTTAINM
ncbi:hypothetical protein OIN60_05470 [Paenibacillus sp. P96]|uniref:Uncharacterized protein n=1 Tax=Paenibacillus zeirhizosphaerae TaxID=2987519 RepID=A0ABT9FNG2_9BACL|nr:hypothetical protein [Paenibacillus sp. P96]MDP4096219.1 hypothetical protein [Paenibacillus sp. P96]